eukprot:TRINITY_DN47764_c0_g1_i1.p1 TRINITY_DN47764_c0_g1~~TRINITY_DN47764_c0_g1_i1.p1  ORF type:complete len:296 (+),score=69.05 TRINITY_DN47764_c0_g1_i1:70-888(+)
MAEAPSSLDAFFKAKAKKKPMGSNMNAGYEKPAAEPAKSGGWPGLGAGDSEGWERALKKDQDIVQKCGLCIKEVEADGACLFRAFADQLDGAGGADHASYRERCVDFLRANRADFEPFIDEDFDEYCTNMRQMKTWGGHVEVQALARALGINVLIHQPTEAPKAEAVLDKALEVAGAGEDARCIQLSFHPQHHHGQHYNSVRWLQDEASDAPAQTCSMPELRRRIEEALTPKEEPKPEPAPKPKAAPKGAFARRKAAAAAAAAAEAEASGAS